MIQHLEINVTELLPNFDPSTYSASNAELGEDAARITWENSLKLQTNLLKTPEQIEAFKEHLTGFGAWDDIQSWSKQQLEALLVQLIAGDIREENDSRLFLGTDGQVYYYIGE